jgi:hypothetical protein
MKDKDLYFAEDENGKYDLVYAYNYCGDGIMPCVGKCEYSCVGSSGENFCGGYGGNFMEFNFNGEIYYIVKCYNQLECFNN